MYIYRNPQSRTCFHYSATPRPGMSSFCRKWQKIAVIRRSMDTKPDFFSAKGKKKKIHSRILRLHYILHEQRKSVLSNSISCPLFLTRFLPFVYAYVKLIAEPINLISNITK